MSRRHVDPTQAAVPPRRPRGKAAGARSALTPPVDGGSAWIRPEAVLALARSVGNAVVARRLAGPTTHVPASPNRAEHASADVCVQREATMYGAAASLKGTTFLMRGGYAHIDGSHADVGKWLTDRMHWTFTDETPLLVSLVRVPTGGKAAFGQVAMGLGKTIVGGLLAFASGGQTGVDTTLEGVADVVTTASDIQLWITGPDAKRMPDDDMIIGRMPLTQGEVSCDDLAEHLTALSGGEKSRQDAWDRGIVAKRERLAQESRTKGATTEGKALAGLRELEPANDEARRAMLEQRNALARAKGHQWTLPEFGPASAEEEAAEEDRLKKRLERPPGGSGS